jgi:hypothetical protein
VSQLILYQGACGIVLTTDSRAVHFAESGERTYFTISKLYPLGATVLMATLGAGGGHTLCRALQERIRAMRISHGKAILDLAFPFLRDALQVRRDDVDDQETDPELQKLYFIIAGTITDIPDEPLGFVVYASESAIDPLHPISTGHFICIPRQLSLETRLQQLPAAEVSCVQVEEICTNFLTRLADLSDDIGEPFVVSRISAEGIATRAVAGGPAKGA